MRQAGESFKRFMACLGWAKEGKTFIYWHPDFVAIDQKTWKGFVMVSDYEKQGYRITSRKYGIISRIDREDWKEYMAKQHAPWDIEEGLDWVRRLGDRAAADHYRRVYSKDSLEIGSKALRLKIPNSGGKA